MKIFENQAFIFKEAMKAIIILNASFAKMIKVYLFNLNEPVSTRFLTAKHTDP